MNYRRLGKTGMAISEIGLGTWALGSRIYGEVEPGAPEAVVREALAAGINFFDTAPLYGTPEEDGVSESVLGAALGAQRNEVFISTKFGRTATQVMPGRFDATEARASCEASLRRLGRDWIDVLFFHSPFSHEEISDGVWAELDRLREAGKVRFLGHSVSMFQQTAPMSADWMRERRIAAIQVVLSPFNREARSLIEIATAEDCGVIARECLANGFLSGAVKPDTVFPDGTLNARYPRKEIAERARYAQRLERAMIGHGVENLPQATYRWVLDQPGVSGALSGAKQPWELEAPVAASALPPFPPRIQTLTEALHLKDYSAA